MVVAHHVPRVTCAVLREHILEEGEGKEREEGKEVGVEREVEKGGGSGEGCGAGCMVLWRILTFAEFSR